MDFSLPGSSVHGIRQARILQWIAIHSSRGSSWSRDQIHVSCGSCLAGHILCLCATGEAIIYQVPGIWQPTPVFLPGESQGQGSMVGCCLWGRTRLKWLSSSKYPMGERNGNPLQYPCLENPVDRGAWWAAVRGVAQSQIRLKLLSMHACIREGNGNPLDLAAAAAAGIQFCNFAGNTELDSYTKRIKLVITILQIEHWGIAVKGKTSKQKRFKAKHSDSRLYVFCYNVKQPLNTTGSFSTGKTKCSLQRLWFFKAVIWEVCNPCLVMLLQLEYFWNGSFGITFIACSSFFE